MLDDQRAIDAYKQALALNPKSVELHSKLGHAFFRVHNFTESVDFYKSAIQTTHDTDLKLQLAEVYVTIKRYTDAEQLLVGEVESKRTKNADDLTSLRYKTRLLLLLAVVQEKAGNLSLAVSTLKEAKTAQGKIKKRLSLEGQAVTSVEETMKLVEINAKLAQLCVRLKDYEQAVNHYKDGLAVAPDDVETLEQLAKLYMQVSEEGWGWWPVSEKEWGWWACLRYVRLRAVRKKTFRIFLKHDDFVVIIMIQEHFSHF